MAHFCAHRHADGGYVLDCQSELLGHLTTRFVVPLIPIADVGTPMARLNPCFDLDGEQLVMMMQFAATVPARSPGPVVTAFNDEPYTIAAALDMLTGY